MKVWHAVKYLLLFVSITLLVLVAILTGLYYSADMKQPSFNKEDYLIYTLEKKDSLHLFGPNHLRLTPCGLWELTLHGDAPSRGVAAGQLTEDLLYYQEKVFVDQIKTFIPSDRYLKFLRFFLVIFNRKLGSYVPEEYREEIHGISLNCTEEYNDIGNPYERQLNYHAAHDIGHTMQDYMLVACSSFGVWGSESEDSTLIIGRNFDFYVGEEFARNKVVSFYYPDNGYRFASVGWAGMIGVLSGMNEKGLTITMNAAKSTVPMSSATPVSLLAREILQYASTIDEAYTIANSRKTFVSESFLICSAKEKKTMIIEKSPYQTVLFSVEGERIISTNHYQSEEFATDKRNKQNIEESDSPYRFNRLQELLNEESPISPIKAATILRDYKGIDGKEIGLSNEKAINQFIAHHSVIFKPEQRLMWVSTSPWQSGAYVCYDLNTIFNNPKQTYDLQTDSLLIPADSFLLSLEYQQLNKYRHAIVKIQNAIKTKDSAGETHVKTILKSNPEMYYAWQLAGDYYLTVNQKEKAVNCWETALTKEIPHQNERIELEKRIRKYKK